MPKLIKDMNGDAVVEAAILFPIMIMVFFALVLLAVYLPTRAALQRATQYAATAIATEKSDTWLFFDKNSMSYRWEDNKSKLPNVYVAMFTSGGDIEEKGRDIVTEIEGRCISLKAGILNVDSHIVNRIIYKEVVITAMRTFTVPVDLSFIGFPRDISVVVTSTAVVQNADEFIRSMDIAADFFKYIAEKLELDNMTDSINEFRSKVKSFLGW